MTTRKEATKAERDSTGSSRRRLFVSEKSHAVSKGENNKSKELHQTTLLSQPQQDGAASLQSEKRSGGQVFETPQKKKKRVRQTDGEEDVPLKRKKTGKEKSSTTTPYVPRYIHKNVEYKRLGEAEISDTTRKTFDLVKKHYELPDDLEQNRIYGPLSGTCYEERAISAYTLNLLTPSHGDVSVQICSQCASEGHQRFDCPELV